MLSERQRAVHRQHRCQRLTGRWPLIGRLCPHCRGHGHGLDSLSNSDLTPLYGTTATPEPSTALADAERVITSRVALMPHRIICAQRLGNQRSHRSTTQHHL
ncbi:hypothetical protein TcG_11660 [Trypanosoma cruzi]|nr:hypothetical protein TcG_11660 [Trypanosoma cruzi]